MTTPPTQADENPDDPNPARSSATLAAFVEQVRRRLGIETEPEAEVLVRTTLNKLGEEISGGLAQQLTTSLPPELSAEIRAQRTDQARPIGKDAFVDQVSGVVGSVDAEEVERQVEQVLRTLRAWLPSDQVDRTLEQMPGDLVALMR